MTTENNKDGSRFVSIKLLVTILIAIVFAATSLIVADTRSGVMNAQLELKQMNILKLDKDQYYRDMADIKEALQRMDIKLDKLTAKGR